MELSIERNDKGFWCFFYVREDQFYADLSIVENGIPECMIFYSYDNHVISWREYYCKRDIPFNEDSLRACIEEFTAQFLLNK